MEINNTGRMSTCLASATLFALILGVDCASVAGAENGDQLLLRGPVDQVNLRTSQVEVLGQWLSPRGVSVDSLKGHFVVVDGAFDTHGGYLVSGITEVKSVEYVPGATPVYLSGVIASIDKSTGVLVIGGTKVDYTGALHTLEAGNLEIGKVASFTGLRFSDPKTIYAANGGVTSDGVTGTDGAVKSPTPAGVTGTDGIISFGVTGTDGAVKSPTPAGVTGTDGITAKAIKITPNGVTGTDGAVKGPTPAGVTGTDGAVKNPKPDGVTGTDGISAKVIKITPNGVTGTDGAVRGPTPAGVTGTDGIIAFGVTGTDGAVKSHTPAGVTGTDGVTAKVIKITPNGVTGTDGAVRGPTPAGVTGTDGAVKNPKPDGVTGTDGG